ncbi:MAG: 5'-nucleotidase [Cellvibrionales bacterium TMED21]|nr:5'-nucleotidase [Halieaceae bacterium]OUT64094.1 MAG: 5'-nucleotidase [Cellvibrionales bacterium TMED21]
MAPEKLVIAISSRALFDLDEEHEVYESQGLAAYSQYQIDHEDTPLAKGQAFPLASKLLALNDQLEDPLGVEIVLLSRNSADTGLRIFNSIEHYGLPITRAAFCGGEPPWRYIQAFGCHLFLSSESADVRKALDNNVAAATLVSRPLDGPARDDIRFAFDGDAVIFSDEAEQIFKAEGLKAFTESEVAQRNEPLSGGPFKNFLSALHALQRAFPESQSPIRTALVTARSAPAHERVIRTLRAWDIRLNESIFLGGLPKVEFLRAYDADVFFDDQQSHCNLAADHIATGHVPHGVANKER